MDAVCKTVSQVLGDVQRLFSNLRGEVVLSHGNHIPIAVRNSAAFVFYLPELLAPMEAVNFELEAHVRLSHRLRHLSSSPLYAYVANQVDAFEWPTTEALMDQYRRLMLCWMHLARDSVVRPLVWTEGGRFVWEQWWRMSHTDRRFAPRGCEAIFSVYHFTGMIGISEARAESVASLLKRYAPPVSGRLATDRIIEKAVLRTSGVSGDGSDDIFLLRCWVEYFNGIQQDRSEATESSSRSCNFRHWIG